MKFGATEIILLLSIPVLIFLCGFWVGKLAGRNAANKDAMKRKNEF